MTSNREKIKQLLSHFSGTSKVLVIINADPDSIASAMAVKRILWRRVSEVVITYFNRITRPDNLAMIEYTEAGMVPLADVDKSLFDKFVVVDSQPDHNENFSGIEYDAIIDHHPLSCNNAAFVDIRPDYGACSSMFTEYLRSLKIKPSAKLASAMMLGIKTDTANFTRQASSRDIRARITSYNVCYTKLLRFYDWFLDYAQKLRDGGKSIIVTGDFNTAHNEIDLKNPGPNAKRSGFLRIERDVLDKMVDMGYVDTFRHFYPEAVKYSWWSYRFNARKNNAGWRIDYFFVTRDLT